MRRYQLVRCISLVLIFAAVSSTISAQTGRRVALVIGNANYQNESTLQNPVNDAQLIKSTLEGTILKFDSVLELSNGTREQMLVRLAQFKALAQGADVALIYYSGHGMINSRRQNHLLPVSMPKISAIAGLDVDTALKAHGVVEDDLIEAVEGARVQLVVLDACRDNGFNVSKSGTKGLARRFDQARNRLIAYATEEGRVALDGSGQYSPYAQSLAEHLPRIDLSILQVFDQVATDVEKSTRDVQVPTRTGNLRTDVYLLSKRTVTDVVAAAVPVPTVSVTQPVVSVNPVDIAPIATEVPVVSKPAVPSTPVVPAIIAKPMPMPATIQTDIEPEAKKGAISEAKVTMNEVLSAKINQLPKLALEHVTLTEYLRNISQLTEEQLKILDLYQKRISHYPYTSAVAYGFDASYKLFWNNSYGWGRKLSANDRALSLCNANKLQRDCRVVFENGKFIQFEFEKIVNEVLKDYSIELQVLVNNYISSIQKIITLPYDVIKND
jgi:Caspase domain